MIPKRVRILVTKSGKHKLLIPLFPTQEERDAYAEQAYEMKANGIRVPSFQKWRARNYALAKLRAVYGKKQT